MKRNFFVPFFLLFILFSACQADVSTTQTAVAEEPSLSDVVTIAPRETTTPTTAPTEVIIEPTAIAAVTASVSPTNTATGSSTALPTEEAKTNNLRPTGTASFTPTPTRTPTPLPALPSGEVVQFPAVAGIGTTLPASQEPITAGMLDQLSEVGRWGKGWVYDAVYTLGGSQMYVLTDQGVYVYDSATAVQQAFYPDNQPYNQLVLSPDGNTIILSTGMYPYYLEFRDAQSFAFLQTFFPFADANIPIAEIMYEQTGQYLFVREGRYIRGGSYVEAQVAAWNLTTNERAAVLEAVGGFAFAPEANLAITNDDEGQLHLWQWRNETFTELKSMLIPEDFHQGNLLAISPDGRYVALSDGVPGPQIAVWQTNSGELLYLVNSSRRQQTDQLNADKNILSKPTMVSGPGRDYPYRLLFSPDSQNFAATNGYYDLTVWQAANGAVIQELTQVGSEMLFHPLEDMVAAWRYAISQWQLDDGSFVNVQNQQIGPVTDLVLIPGRNQLAIASADGYIYLRALRNGDLFTSLRAAISNETFLTSPSVTDIDVTADGQTLVSASNDAYRVWDLTNGDMDLLSPIPRSDIGADHMTISNDGKYILGAEHDMNVWLWVDQEKDPLYPNNFSPFAIAFSPISYMFATTKSFDSSTVLMWADSDEIVPLQPTSDDDRVENFVFSADGRYLASALENDKVLIWDVLADPPQLLFRGEANSVSAYGSTAAFSPENQIVAQSAKQFVRFWDMESGELLFNLNTGVQVNAMTFTPDGQYLITGHSDGTVRFWTVP